MSDDFDPYHRWLGIAPEHRPPNHYQLLGIPQFESDREVIASAADRQMAHVRSFQSGKHSAQTQRILNELAVARVCLLSAEQKAQYDEQLRQAQAETPHPTVAGSIAIRTNVGPPRRFASRGRPMSLVGLGIFTGIVAGVAATVIAIASLNRREGQLLITMPNAAREELVVTIDGRQRPVAAEGKLSYRLASGEHEVKVELPAHIPFEEIVEIPPGQRREVKVQLRPQARLAIELMGRQPEDLRLTIDGVPHQMPSTRSLVLPCEPGVHHVVAISGRGRFDKSVTVLPNQTYRVPLAILAEHKLSGHWSGEIEIDHPAVDRKLDQSKTNPLIRAFVQQSLETLKAGKFDLELEPDGAYRLTVKLGGLSSQSHGKWAITQESGSRLTIEFTPADGPVEFRQFHFSGEDAFTTDLPKDLAEFGHFQCRRQKS